MSTDERLEICDATGRPIGTAPRSRVHREGLWHRAVNVFLFRADGRLIVQRRQSSKDVCPGAWDLTVAEHLAPGETYARAALRGLSEELGIEGVALEPVGSVARVRFELASCGLKDFELQQSFHGVFDGDVRPNAAEVCAVDALAIPDLAAAFEQRPGDFTPWFRESAIRLGFVPGECR